MTGHAHDHRDEAAGARLASRIDTLAMLADELGIGEERATSRHRQGPTAEQQVALLWRGVGAATALGDTHPIARDHVPIVGVATLALVAPGEAVGDRTTWAREAIRRFPATYGGEEVELAGEVVATLLADRDGLWMPQRTVLRVGSDLAADRFYAMDAADVLVAIAADVLCSPLCERDALRRVLLLQHGSVAEDVADPVRRSTLCDWLLDIASACRAHRWISADLPEARRRPESAAPANALAADTALHWLVGGPERDFAALLERLLPR